MANQQDTQTNVYRTIACVTPLGDLCLGTASMKCVEGTLDLPYSLGLEGKNNH